MNGMGVWQDVRYGVRVLAKSPGFTIVAALSLALGIGANTAIFSILNGILLRSLPVRDAHQLRVIHWTATGCNMSNFTGSTAKWGPDGTCSDVFCYPGYRDFRDRLAGKADVFAFFPLYGVTVQSREGAVAADGLMVTGNFFPAYGAAAAMGRALGPDDDRRGAEPVAVITNRFWERKLGFDPGVLGRTIVVNGLGCTIVGVLPRGYIGPLIGDAADVYVPMATQPKVAPDYSLESYDNWWVEVMARLTPGVTEAQVQAQSAAILTDILAQSKTRLTNPGILVQDGSAGAGMMREYAAQPVFALQAVVAIVLLIACANLAGLSLARATARRREAAVCAALGAGRGRILRCALVENGLLASVGALAALPVAVWVKAAVMSLAPNLGREFHFDVRMDARVLLFTMGIALLTALASGLLPAWRMSQANPAADLQSARVRGPGRQRLVRLLIATQVGLSVVLLAGAGLFLRSVNNLRDVDLGFNAEHLLSFRASTEAAGTSAEQRLALFDNIQRTLEGLPGVKAVGFSRPRLINGDQMTNGFLIPGRPDESGDDRQANVVQVSEGFLAAMGIPLLKGRDFAVTDAGSGPRVTIINHLLAQKFFPQEDAIGRTVKVGDTEYLVIGVCGDTQYHDLRSDKRSTMLFSNRQSIGRDVYFEIRTALPPLSLMPAVRQAVAAVDATVPLSDVATQTELNERSIFFDRMFAAFCTALAALAVLLSCVGLYGLLAYNVARRTSEIGVRMALGAGSAGVAAGIVRGALSMTAGGLAAGLPAVALIGWAARKAFYGVAPYDPITMAGVATLLLFVTGAAAWIPARRAARIDPMTALRYE
jgi:predicted permease